MKKYILATIAAMVLAGCSFEGPLTGHQYSFEQTKKVAEFLGVSYTRAKRMLSGDIRPEDANISKERLKQAVEYIKEYGEK